MVVPLQMMLTLFLFDSLGNAPTVTVDVASDRADTYVPPQPSPTATPASKYIDVWVDPNGNITPADNTPGTALCGRKLRQNFSMTMDDYMEKQNRCMVVYSV